VIRGIGTPCRAFLRFKQGILYFPPIFSNIPLFAHMSSGSSVFHLRNSRFGNVLTALCGNSAARGGGAVIAGSVFRAVETSAKKCFKLLKRKRLDFRIHRSIREKPDLIPSGNDSGTPSGESTIAAARGHECRKIPARRRSPRSSAPATRSAVGRRAKIAPQGQCS